MIIIVMIMYNASMKPVVKMTLEIMIMSAAALDNGILDERKSMMMFSRNA